MKRRKLIWIIAALAAVVLIAGLAACSLADDGGTTADSGARAATSDKVATNSSGDTAEQSNIKKRITEENQPGAIKYFYAISAYNNSYIYATVKGKVTSSNKRLIPSTVSGLSSDLNYTMDVTINGQRTDTNEVMNEDGTYGTSMEYLYFWDPQGQYYQFYPTGGWQIIISDHPIALPDGVVAVQMTPTTK